MSHTEDISTDKADLTGGAAILFPPGWHVEEEIVLVKGRAVAALVKDRTCSFYILSVYIHPDDRRRDIEKLLQAWRYITKKSDHVFISGDFNNVDVHLPDLWDRFLITFGCKDVNPELVTCRFCGGASKLDR